MNEFYTCWSEISGGCKQAHKDIRESMTCRVNTTTPMILHVAGVDTIHSLDIFDAEKLWMFSSFFFPGCAVPDDSPLDEEQANYIGDILADITSFPS